MTIRIRIPKHCFETDENDSDYCGECHIKGDVINWLNSNFKRKWKFVEKDPENIFH